MGVKAPLGDVVDSRRKSSGNQPGHEVEAIAQLVLRVIDRALGLSGDGEDLVTAHFGPQGRALQEIDRVTRHIGRSGNHVDRAAAVIGDDGSGIVTRWGIHLPHQHICCPGIVGRLAHVAVLLRITEGDPLRMRGCKGLRRLTTDCDTDSWIRPLATAVKVVSKPSLRIATIGIRCCLPDLRGTEMGTVRIGISDPLDHAQTSLAVKIPQTR